MTEVLVLLGSFFVLCMIGMLVAHALGAALSIVPYVPGLSLWLPQLLAR